jgi:enoyl-CoA hydratase/carnithine racemase
MPWHEFIVDAQRLWAGDAGDFGPLALIDLDTATDMPGSAELELALPSCPVIGFGNRDHPLASRLDAIVEPPVGLPALAHQITAFPRAAAVFVDLLRLLPGLDNQAGLVAESLAYAVVQGSAEHARWLVGTAKNVAGTPPGQLIMTREAALLRLTLDRPASGNAIDRAMRDQLNDAFAVAALDHTITHILLTARGRTFCLGADLAEFGTTRDPATAHAIRRQTLPARHIARCADRLEVHVQGGCVGAGLEMAAWAGRITAAPNAWFHLPEMGMGILPGAGGSVALTRRIGRQRTALLVLSGKRISARTALDWGLIDAIVDEASVDDRDAHVIG